MRDDFVSLTGQIMSARVTGDAATIANAEAIYQTQYGAMLHNADVQLQNVSAQLALNPTDSQAQAAMASAQTLVDGLVAANNVVQQFLSATG